MGLPARLLTLEFNDVTVCYCDARQAGLRMCHDAQLIKVKSCFKL
jgi:hypothetical protein